ncbi:hypothetical protein PTSG_11636 [Salpingoeca rosetta]|uniref:Annexin n=1 Tax=Salpingoeca rosetta (strain ATCC 50818 / BSB-021) TaxID=946362 RepID=F2TXB8_SALR5|nr:uncharacterized protein PTSG_11636 [Salpingoeca rosetta]EGD76027.1 hypothetical protein PTSG_11636 [Salpingoeca rosetta]|eukprot:XP_004998202.1 hypothetical protein PTSG_11636 [Salpingoeca rosetta]
MAESFNHGYAGGMRKPRKYNIENTNIAMLGTDLEKAVRQQAAETEKAWQQVNTKKPTLMVWRIEQFKVVAVDKEDYGTFYDGDSYIILHSYFKDGQGALVYDIHFWIGSQSSQDEYGTAAYKTVELDDFLGGKACQYREVQDHESRRFKSIFRSIIVMEGGVKSGFRHVKPREYRNRLLHIKGKLNTIAMEVAISCDSLNAGDSFVFDAGLNLYVWHGKNAGIMEKTKAANLAQALDDSRGGMAVRHVFDQDDRDHDFFKAMGVEKGAIKDKDEGGSDAQVTIGEKRLLRLSDSGGSLQMNEVAKGDDIRRDMLNTKDVFILDDGYEIMVWVGLEASMEERRQALNRAAEYLKSNGKPMTTPISKIYEGGENELFEAAFEVGVRSGGDAEAIANASRSKAVASSATAGYKGSGGPGTVVDMDALYNQNGVDPAQWGGRGKAPSLYALELQAKKAGAYSPTSGWVSGHTQRERQLKQARIAELEQHYAANRKARSESGDTSFASVKPFINFDPKADAMKVRKAIKGLGTNEKVLIQIFSRRTIDQRAAISGAYFANFDRDLEADLRSDTGGNFRTALLALIMNESERLAYFVYKSMKGWGTEENLLIDILCTRESDEIVKIHEAYHARYPDRDLEKDITADTSGDFRRVLMAILKCNRAPVQSEVDAEAARADAEILYKAGEKKWFGTDESKFIEILSERSFPQIKAIVDAYEGMSKRSLRGALKSELSGDFKNACLAIVDYACDPSFYVCRRLYQTMKGWGTSDWALINFIVDHCERDMDLIKERYPGVVSEISSDGKPRFLGEMIRGDTGGNYRKLLLALIGEGTVA